MFLKRIRGSFILTLIFLLICSTYVSAVPLVPGWQEPVVYSTKIIEDRLEMTSLTTGIFHYKLFDINGKDITSEFPVSDLFVDVNLSESGWGSSGRIPQVSLDPQTGTCTLTYNFSQSDKYVKVHLMPRYSYSDTKTLIVGNSDEESLKRVDELHILTDSLTSSGANSATFRYNVINFIDDITSKIPASQIEAFSAPGSEITLDPATGTGTIAFDTLDTDQFIKTTLRDKLTGVTAVLNTLGLDPVPASQVTTPSAISRVDFVSSDLVKTETGTATFQYKLLDHYYTNITKTIPSEDLKATAIINSTHADVSLEPETGTGTITYDFSDNDEQVLVTLAHQKGMEISALLNLHSPSGYEANNTENNTDEDLEIAQISFLPTGKLSPNITTYLHYRILNKEGKDITPKIPASELSASSSVNSMITLKPSDREFRITYNFHDSDKTILVSLEDKATGVKTSINIGNMPPEPGSEENIVDNTAITFKDPVLEQAVRKLIYKPTAEIYKNDVKNIPDLYIDKGCKDLSGIENLTGLVSLAIHSDHIDDLSPLTELPKLRNLNYQGTLND
ncbi:hypothetical protein [Desulfitobacterium sp. PCE1]|uniref:hypothetical protein n=1 Tax=Desulfitobacterium sp. PCE1 TaxID=146907 RepID=UPI00035CFC04|nr:hypothetical protein [Desulfitobacterium sp. PCE1]